MYFFEWTYCGRLLGDGCGAQITLNLWADYIGITFRGGIMVYVFDTHKEMTCPHCGNVRRYIYAKCGGGANEAVEAERKVEEAVIINRSQ